MRGIWGRIPIRLSLALSLFLLSLSLARIETEERGVAVGRGASLGGLDHVIGQQVLLQAAVDSLAYTTVPEEV